MEFERQTTVGFVESDDFDQRQSNVDDDRFPVIGDRSNVTVVVDRVQQRRHQSMFVLRRTARLSQQSQRALRR